MYFGSIYALLEAPSKYHICIFSHLLLVNIRIAHSVFWPTTQSLICLMCEKTYPDFSVESVSRDRMN